VKIGPVDTEIALLIVKKEKKEEINACKIYSPRSAGLPSRLNKSTHRKTHAAYIVGTFASR